MAFKGVFFALLVSFMSCLPSTDSFKLSVPTDNNTITVENGVESNVDFFLNDYPSLNTQIRIIVQYQRGAGAFDRKCQIVHSKTSGCSVQFGPCQCMGESSGSSYRYRLNMTFTNQDAGRLLLEIMSYYQISITVNVREYVRTTHKPTRAPTPVARPPTTRPNEIPTTSTPTTMLTSRLVEVATAAGTTHHHVLHTPGPDNHETANNRVDGDENKENGENHKTGESLLSGSENENNHDGEVSTQASGSGFVEMNAVTISFLVIASLWRLM